MSYSISEESLQARKKNIILSALFSLLLIAVTTGGHLQHPETYNDLFFWSVVVFVTVGNVFNYFRYRRYLRMIKDHRIEIIGDTVAFITAGEKSELNVKDIVMLTYYRKKGTVEHIQLKLRNNRGIRLESYAELEKLGGEIADLMPAQQVVGRQP